MVVVDNVDDESSVPVVVVVMEMVAFAMSAVEFEASSTVGVLLIGCDSVDVDDVVLPDGKTLVIVVVVVVDVVGIVVVVD